MIMKLQCITILYNLSQNSSHVYPLLVDWMVDEDFIVNSSLKGTTVCFMK